MNVLQAARPVRAASRCGERTSCARLCAMNRPEKEERVSDPFNLLDPLDADIKATASKIEEERERHRTALAPLRDRLRRLQAARKILVGDTGRPARRGGTD